MQEIFVTICQKEMLEKPKFLPSYKNVDSYGTNKVVYRE